MIISITQDEFQLIRILIKTQRFNPDPRLVELRKKFSAEEPEVQIRVVKGEEG